MQFRVLYRRPGEFGWFYGWTLNHENQAAALKAVQRSDSAASKARLEWRVQEILTTDVDYTPSRE